MTTGVSADSARLPISSEPLSAEELRKMNDYWRAANYLSAGQIYLYANPLLREPLKLEHVKPRLLGHWGTTPGLNFIYTLLRIETLFGRVQYNGDRSYRLKGR